MKKYILLILFPTLLGAKTYQLNPVPESQILDKLKIQAVPKLTKEKPLINTRKKQKPIEIDSKTLLANPSLLKRAMNSVLLNQQIDGIKVVLPIYRKLTDADKLLITYAEALLAHNKGQLSTAIKNYRQLIAENPKLSFVRLNLAMALYHNHQSAAARNQLIRLQSEKLSLPVTNIIAQTLKRIDREEDWQFDVNFYYRQENNINNVPKQREIKYGSSRWTFPAPEKAHGIHLGLGAKKRFNLGDHIYSKLHFDASSDFYWDHHDYDDLSLRIGTGLGYQTAKFNAEIQPFLKKRFYGTKPYSLNTGATGYFSYQLSPQWKLSNHWEWSYEHFDKQKFLNGQRRFVALSALYIPTPQQYWSVGINYYDSQAQQDSDSYHRKGGFVAWGQEWPKGLSSSLMLSFGKRKHKDFGFPNIKRHDKEYATRLSLWHRSIHYWGITPRLVWIWNKTDSNHFLYNKKESKINIEFSKTF